jgi:DNA invertase Pin-like site-specific DNA recombinase
MARGRRTQLGRTVRRALDAPSRALLETWQRSQTLSAGRKRRARLILLLAQGLSVTETAHAVGISRRFVYLWARRFLAEGVNGLHDRPGGGQARPRASVNGRTPTPHGVASC